MGFSITSPAPEKCDPTAENRVWGFFGDEINGNMLRDSEVLSYAYESEPNTPILTGAVPELSTAFLLMILPVLAWRRGR